MSPTTTLQRVGNLMKGRRAVAQEQSEPATSADVGDVLAQHVCRAETEYQEALAARARAVAALEQAQADLERLESELGQLNESQHARNDSNALAILKGVWRSEDGVRDRKADLQEKYEAAFRTVPIARRAIALADQQLNEARSERSAAICRLVSPEYREIVRRSAKALVELVAIAQEEMRFQQDLESRDISAIHLRPHPWTEGYWPDGSVAMWIREGVERGYFTAEETQEWAGEAGPVVEAMIFGRVGPNQPSLASQHHASRLAMLKRIASVVPTPPRDDVATIVPA